MPGVAPSSFRSRSGVALKPIDYEPSWTKVPFDNYEGMTQQQFQDSIAPFSNHGKLVPVNVPKGWRRVEGAHPGKHMYIHMSTGAISHHPQEIYDCKKECWFTKEGVKITQEELSMSNEARIMKVAYADKPVTTTTALAVAVPTPVEAAVEKKEIVESKVEEPTVEAAPEEVAQEVPVALSEPKLPIGLLFPGQGSQYVKMCTGVLKDVPEVKTMFEEAEMILGWDLKHLCLKGPESQLELTKFCQPALFVGGLAGVEKLKVDKPEQVEQCQAVAGLSLGEYTALTVAGVFDFKTGLTLVKLRGEAMQEAAEASPQSMLSVAGLPQETLAKLCKEACEAPDDVCQIANVLFPNGFSCAGSRSAVERLMKTAQATEGCMQAKLLKTSGGFHTSLMAPAKERLMAALKEAQPKMKPPRCDVYMNVTGKKITAATTPEEIVGLLADQLVNPVQWQPAVQEMIKDGVTTFYECGPMKQLKAMMKRIDPTAFKSTTTIDV